MALWRNASLQWRDANIMVNISKCDNSCPHCPILYCLPTCNGSVYPDLLRGIPEEHCKYNGFKAHITLWSVLLGSC